MPKFCTNCGKPLQFENAEICPGCGVRLQPPPGIPVPGVPVQAAPATEERRSPLLSLILSFFCPGWGQWYNGLTWEGLGFFGGYVAASLLMVVLSILAVRTPSAGILVLLFIVVLLGIWVYGMYHAFTTAQQINRNERAFSGKSVLFWLPVVLIILSVVLVILAAVMAAFVFGMAGSVPYS